MTFCLILDVLLHIHIHELYSCRTPPYKIQPSNSANLTANPLSSIATIARVSLPIAPPIISRVPAFSRQHYSIHTCCGLFSRFFGYIF